MHDKLNKLSEMNIEVILGLSLFLKRRGLSQEKEVLLLSKADLEEYMTLLDKAQCLAEVSIEMINDVYLSETDFKDKAYSELLLIEMFEKYEEAQMAITPYEDALSKFN